MSAYDRALPGAPTQLASSSTETEDWTTWSGRGWIDPPSTEVRAENWPSYRQNRMLNPAEQADLVTLYEAGATMLELPKSLSATAIRPFGICVEADAEVRPQKKMTPE